MLRTLDAHVTEIPERPELSGVRRALVELAYFVLIGFFIWLAENVSTFFSIWRYPDQLGAWTMVHWSKWSSWSLLVVMTFTIVANLKHIKERVHIPA